MRNGDHLFSEGEARRAVYRVESGALCHYIVWPDGHHDVIEFAFPGDIVGFGHLPEYISTAQAIVDTRVTLLDGDAFARAVSGDAALASRLSAAADREFEFVRSRSLGAGGRPAVQRLAAYLLAMASSACRSGEMTIVPGDTDWVALANLLEIPQADLAQAWAELEARDLAAGGAHGLVLKDLPALERLADTAA